jgi:quercetin dioxygenase-like cupin family protein
MTGQLKIGNRIRRLRLIQKRTIQEIAEACDLSKSMVSKIETNSVVPSVATLVKIARNLGTNVSVLMGENETQSCVFISAKEAGDNVAKTDRGYYIFPIASEFKDKKMQPFLFKAKKGEVKEHHLTHDGEEFIHVLEGKLKFSVGGKDYILNEGDSVYFSASEEHGMMPISDSVRYLNIFV